MSFIPNNFISYAQDKTHFGDFEFSSSSSPFRSSEDYDTKSETPFGLSSGSSGNHTYSTPYNTDFDFDAFMNPRKRKPFKISKIFLLRTGK